MQQGEIRIAPLVSVSLGLSELWQSRELLYFFVWRDVKVKYKQTYLGILWAILQPALLMCIFYFVFSRALNIQVGMNYFVYTLSGLTLWGLFSSGITNSTESLVSHSSIIRKIYFPKLLIPLSSLFAALVDFFFAFILLLVFLIILRQKVSFTALYLFPAGIVLAFVASFSVGTLLSSFNVKYRDLRYLLPFVIQVLLFGSQIVYAIAFIKPSWLKPLLYINPLNGALELFRAPFKQNELYMPGILISGVSTGILLLLGLYYFKKTEVHIADLV
jgi:lipopolysaccharide transport system permease protein